MRSTPAGLIADMAGAATTMAHLVKLTRTDGVIFAATDHDQTLPYGGVDYLPTIGADASAIITTALLNVDNLEIKGFLSLIGITDSDVASGYWDFCEVRIFYVNWADLAKGDEKKIRGWLGEVSIEGDTFTNEVLSLAQKLQSRIIEIVSPGCAADLFDARCKVAPTEGVNMFSNVAVSTILNSHRQFTAVVLTQAPTYFTGGKVLWQTGDNEGLSKEIKTHSAMGSGGILLQETMPNAIQLTDTFRIYAGCLKRYAEDCGLKHNNQKNFRGYPFTPGNDAALRGPQ